MDIAKEKEIKISLRESQLKFLISYLKAEVMNTTDRPIALHLTGLLKRLEEGK